MYTEFYGFVITVYNFTVYKTCTITSAYSGTSLIQTSIIWVPPAQISLVAYSLLTIIKFGLDKSTGREPKGCCLPGK